MSAQSFRSLVGIPLSAASASDATTALIIIDAQNEYRTGKLQVTNHASSSVIISSLLQKFRAGKGKVVHVLHQAPDGAPVFTPGTELAEEFGELKPKESDAEVTVKKWFPGSFAETDLHERLKGWGVKKVVLVGYMAHVCVSTTAREADQHGYDVIVVEDGVGDRDIPGATGEEVTKMVLLELADCFATVVKSEEIK